MCKISFFHCRNILKLWPLLYFSDVERLVHAFVSSRRDYCNALLVGIPSQNTQRLQYVQNCAARILMRLRKHERITPILQSLHWLPVSARITYKISLITFHCLHDNAPSYLKDLLTLYCSSRSLRSSNTNLHTPRTRSRTNARPCLFLRCPSAVECSASTSEGSTDRETLQNRPENLSFHQMFLMISL